MAAAVVLAAGAVLGSTSVAGAAIDRPPLEVSPSDPVVGENITVTGAPCFILGEGDETMPGEVTVEFIWGDLMEYAGMRMEEEKKGEDRHSSGELHAAVNPDGTWSISWAPEAEGDLRIQVKCAVDADRGWKQQADSTVGARPEIIVSVDKHTVYVTDEVTVNGEGFLPGEDVDVVLHSKPTKLGTLTADKAGMVTGTFKIPFGAVLGNHEVHLTGVTSGRTGLDKVTIIAGTTGLSGDNTGPDTTNGSSIEGAGANRTTGSRSNGNAAELAFTGGSSSTLALLGLVTLLGGTALVATGRRLNRAEVD